MEHPPGWQPAGPADTGHGPGGSQGVQRLSGVQAWLYSKAEYGEFDLHVENWIPAGGNSRSEEHTTELQSLRHLVCRLLLEKQTRNRRRTRQRPRILQQILRREDALRP